MKNDKEKTAELNSAKKDLIYLLSCAINQTAADTKRVEDMDLTLLYNIASRHMVRAAVAAALRSAGIHNKAFKQAEATAIRRAVLFKMDMEALTARLEAEGIWYMPLKGAVLKNLYPLFGMREMSDHDILFDADRAEDVKTIMEDLGFTTESYGGSNHDCYHKKPVSNFELHRSLFGTSHEENVYNYYLNIKDRLIKDKDNNYGYHFSPEDFYIYMIAHEYKHYSASGTGIRSLMDTYVFLKTTPLNMAYIKTETEKLGIADFEHANRHLALEMFGQKASNTSPKAKNTSQKKKARNHKMLAYIFSSGTYGTIAHRVENSIKKNGGSKIRYMLDRFFVPVSKKNKEYPAYAAQYPFFYKHKIFLPALPFYRTFRAMKGGRFKPEAKAIRDARPKRKD